MGESGHSNRIETERALTGHVGHREPGRAAGRLSSKMTYQASGHLALEQDISAPEAVPANHPGLAEATDGTFVSSRWPEPMAGADQPGTARVLSGTVCVRDGMAYRVSPELFEERDSAETALVARGCRSTYRVHDNRPEE